MYIQHSIITEIIFQFFLGDCGDDVDPPVVTEQPYIPSTIQRKEPLRFSVSAEGQGELAFHWIKDGVAFFEEQLSNCTGTNTPMLCITSFAEEHEGEYKCVVSNAGGSVESNTVELFGKTLYIVSENNVIVKNDLYSCRRE